MSDDNISVPLIRRVTVYKDIFQIMIDRAISHVEETHLTIALFRLENQHHGKVSELEKRQLQTVYRQRVGKAYNLARALNRQWGHLMSDFLGVLEHRKNIKYLIEHKG